MNIFPAKTIGYLVAFAVPIIGIIYDVSYEELYFESY